MRIVITSGTDPLLTLHVGPGRSVKVEATRLLRSRELRRMLALALATLAEERQFRTWSPLDVATVDVSA